MDEARVAIIGAGVSGLACARVLSEAGVSVSIYDKGRGPGGRCSSRRTPHGRFDHGAQFFTVRDDRFAAQVSRWQDAELVTRWDGDFAVVKDGEAVPYRGDPRFVGTPKMSAFVGSEAETFGAQFGLRMGTPRWTGDRWALMGENGQSAWAADWIVLAVPAEQTAALLLETPASRHLLDAAQSARSDPTWTLMAAFDEDAARPFDAAAIDGGPLSWVSYEASKPGRATGARWVAHASAEWSLSRLEETSGSVAPQLVDALSDVVGTSIRPAYAAVHRWRYAHVARTAHGTFGLDAEGRLGTCGDWHVAPRIESAWLSGHELGLALLDRLR